MKKGQERKKATKTDNGLLYSCVMDIVEAHRILQKVCRSTKFVISKVLHHLAIAICVLLFSF